MANSAPTSEQAVLYEKRGKIAIITLNLEKKLNALTQEYYFRIAKLLNEIAKDDSVYITVLTAKGRFFSAGADVGISRAAAPGVDPYKQWLGSFVANNLNTTRAFYTHPKILVAALNGPAVGLSAALLGFADFIYAAPHTFLLTPFSSLGLVAEGLASRSFVQRLGVAKANEALIMSKRITCPELVQCGFVNKVFDTKPNESDKFLELVLKEVEDRMGDHLVPDSMTKIKELIRKPERDILDAQGVAEVFGGLDRFLSGVPQEEFRKIGSGEKKHKL
ncbi:dodecenoyl-CoA isomerase [Recurvomyces mirabilis]|nr:dodecenoyl-CoA isomerase [Recurvomyces mirabilis]